MQKTNERKGIGLCSSNSFFFSQMKMTNENENKHRIELLEIEEESIEDEIKSIEVTIQKLKSIQDNIHSRETSGYIKKFISELENNKLINEEQKKQIKHDIENVRGLKEKYGIF
jgi:predicted  nucleic acid-binding Zn-ribbon protein